ncbi:MAG: hypothetical protein K2X77_03910 [Candidatus Obscuribacterales bacterium]|nr:hypothetical protein [Candidatus Obscuribacterales bacterium]
MNDRVVNSSERREQQMIFGEPMQFDAQPKTMEQLRVDAAAESRSLLSVDAALYIVARESGEKNKVFSAKPGGEKMTPDILNIGAIDEMKLPTGWTKGAEKQNIAGQGTSKQFLAPGKNDVEITVFDRGRRYSANANAFKSVLDKAPHVISPFELQSISTVLGNYNDARAFEMSSCKTENINGKNVLVIEGTWKANGHKSYSVIANPDGKGETVQEIYFKAPEPEYKAQANSAIQSIKSIRWK